MCFHFSIIKCKRLHGFVWNCFFCVFMILSVFFIGNSRDFLISMHPYPVLFVNCTVYSLFYLIYKSDALQTEKAFDIMQKPYWHRKGLHSCLSFVNGSWRCLPEQCFSRLRHQPIEPSPWHSREMLPSPVKPGHSGVMIPLPHITRATARSIFLQMSLISSAVMMWHSSI